MPTRLSAIRPLPTLRPGCPKTPPPAYLGYTEPFGSKPFIKDAGDASGRTLYAIYHNENYPETLPFDPATGEGYIDKNWPLGLTERITPAAICRIGVMKSTNGGWSWENKGLL